MTSHAPFGLLRRARLCPVAHVRYRAALAARAARKHYAGDRILGHVAALNAIVRVRAVHHIGHDWQLRVAVPS